MENLPSEIQEKLRAQAEKVRDDLYLGNCLHTERALCDDCAKDRVVKFGKQMFALGVSSERARQQGLRDSLRSAFDDYLIAEVNRHNGIPSKPKQTMAMEEAVAELLCADELEASQ